MLQLSKMSNVNFCALMELVDLYFCFEIIGHFSKPKEEFFNSDDMYPQEVVVVEMIIVVC